MALCSFGPLKPFERDSWFLVLRGFESWGKHMVGLSESCTYHVFPQRRGPRDYPRELENFENLGSYSLPQESQMCVKYPLRVA